MYVLQMIRDFSPQMLAGGVTAWVLFLVALKLASAVWVDGGLLPPPSSYIPPPSEVSEQTDASHDDCITIEGVEVCSSDVEDGPV